MRRLWLVALVVSGVARAQSVTVDAAADQHPISPLIYGMNFPSAAQASAVELTLARWGGNRTTRYNYTIDVDNTGNDYYFENLPGCWGTGGNYCNPQPTDPKTNSSANAFLQAAAGNWATFFTVPTMGWVAKSPPVYMHPFTCGFPKTLFPTQDSFDPYEPNCGNGIKGGAPLTPPAPTTTSVAADASFTGGWVTYLTGKFGASNGQRIYLLDNEPNLWSSTHRDVHPMPPTYDELWQKMRDNAVAILAADPTALVGGPAEWGWPNYFCSAADLATAPNTPCVATMPDRAAHGGEELAAWLLDQARAYEQANGKRILHYFDLHYYPQGGAGPANTRSLWDSSYVDPSWINDKIRLLPRMRDWVNQHYPGTKISLSEYDFGDHTSAAGAITQAEALGLFGREGLDAATMWSPPAATEAAFGGFLLYRNFDGQGGQFESLSVRTTVAGNGLAAFASTSTTRVTIVLVNEGAATATVPVTLASFQPGATARWYTGAGVTLTRQPDVAVSGATATVTLPATSFGMLVVDGTNLAPQPDLGVVDDAAVPADGAASPPGDVVPAPGSSGCSCEMGGRASVGAPSLLALLLLALCLRRRRT